MKRKKILLIIIPILLVLLAATILALLYFTTDVFKSNDVLFAKYIMQIEELLSIVQNENLNNQTDLKKYSTYISDGDLAISIDDGTNIQEMNATTATRYDANTERLYSELNLKNGEEDLLKVSFINSDDVYAIKCDDILGNYIGFRNSDLKTFAKNMGMTDEEIELIPDSIELNSLNDFLEITEEQKQHIINNYLSVITDNISKDKFTKVDNIDVTINNIDDGVNGYTLSIDTNTIKKMSIDLLNKLKEDNITLTLLSNKLSIFGLEDEYTDITNLSKVLDEAVVKMQEDETTNEEIMRITAYAYKGKTIRSEILFLEEGEKIGKISIDIESTDNVKEANIIVEDVDEYSSFSEEEGTNTVFSQITLEKTITDTSIINRIMYIPDTTNMSEYTSTEINIGKVQNNAASNTSNVTISTSIDENTVQQTTASYIQKIEMTSQVDEIMELKNSNAVIINNYSLEQLTPFLTSLGNKTMQVVSNKIEQLEIGSEEDLTSDSGISSNIENTGNYIMQMVQAAVASGSCIINVNGNLTELGANVGFYMATYVMKMSMMLQEAGYSNIESQPNLENQISLQGVETNT